MKAFADLFDCMIVVLAYLTDSNTNTDERCIFYNNAKEITALQERIGVLLEPHYNSKTKLSTSIAQNQIFSLIPVRVNNELA